MRMVIRSLILLSLFSIIFSRNVSGTDHADGPVVLNNPAADITDVYAWMQDTTTLNLIMNVFPGADENSKFSSSLQYVFHINSSSAYGEKQTETTITCEFDADQKVSCRTPSELLVNKADASSTSGVNNADRTFKIFTGLRNDPSFFDEENFELARMAFRDVADTFNRDEAQCPRMDDTNRDEIRSTYTASVLGVPGTNAPAQDTYESSNVLSIVIQVSKEILGQGPIFSVWGSTHD